MNTYEQLCHFFGHYVIFLSLGVDACAVCIKYCKKCVLCQQMECHAELRLLVIGIWEILRLLEMAGVSIKDNSGSSGTGLWCGLVGL
jgi:hypothetical protein